MGILGEKEEVEMLGRFEDFFVELAQLLKKHSAISTFGAKFPITFMNGYEIIGQYKVTETWITKEGEAVLRVRSEDKEYEIYSDGRVSK